MIARNFGHPANAILRAIADLIRIGADDRQKPIIVIEDVCSTDWASITFSGQRHVFELRLEGDADAVAAAIGYLTLVLPDHDLPLTGHFVAEIGVEEQEDRDVTACAMEPAAICTNFRHVQVTALVLRD